MVWPWGRTIARMSSTTLVHPSGTSVLPPDGAWQPMRRIRGSPRPGDPVAAITAGTAVVVARAFLMGADEKKTDNAPTPGAVVDHCPGRHLRPPGLMDRRGEGGPFDVASGMLPASAAGSIAIRLPGHPHRPRHSSSGSDRDRRDKTPGTVVGRRFSFRDRCRFHRSARRLTMCVGEPACGTGFCFGAASGSDMTRFFRVAGAAQAARPPTLKGWEVRPRARPSRCAGAGGAR